MASASARVIQAVKPHNPLIKFRAGSARSDRGKMRVRGVFCGGGVFGFFSRDNCCDAGVSQCREVLTGPTQTTASSAAMKATSSAASAKSKPVGSLPRGSGIDESQLPARYARKPLSPYEGDYIQRGGPE
uniref:Putative 28s ribosomal protein s36 mitochondrial n=1 Tax=Rhipicephalus microplus TaxID=6941 RepID=A0A6M2CZW1_RHIMP